MYACTANTAQKNEQERRTHTHTHLYLFMSLYMYVAIYPYISIYIYIYTLDGAQDAHSLGLEFVSPNPTIATILLETPY